VKCVPDVHYQKLGSAASCPPIACRFFFSERAVRSDKRHQRRLASDRFARNFTFSPEELVNDPNGPIRLEKASITCSSVQPGADSWATSQGPRRQPRHDSCAISARLRILQMDRERCCFTVALSTVHGTATIVIPASKFCTADANLREGVHTFREVQCLALPDDANSQLAEMEAPTEPRNDPRLPGSRPISLARRQTTWYRGVGAGFRKRRLRSPLSFSRLRKWELSTRGPGNGPGAHPFNPVDSGETWECHVSSRWEPRVVLLYSTAAA